MGQCWTKQPLNITVINSPSKLWVSCCQIVCKVFKDLICHAVVVAAFLVHLVTPPINHLCYIHPLPEAFLVAMGGCKEDIMLLLM